jgi:raffinose/stachyose/melibiose transport system substrate-binding protein
MRSSKRIISLLIATMFIMVFLFTGCGSTGSDANTTSSAAVATPAASTQAEQKPEEKVTIKMWAQTGTQEAWSKWFKAKVEATYPDITLDISNAPGDNLGIAKLTTTLGTNDSPDIVATWSYVTIVPPLAKAGKLLDLTEFYADNKLEGVFPKSGDVVKVDNKVYIVPFHGLTSPVIYYNKGIFDKLGLAVPATEADLLDVSDKLRAGGYQPLAIGLKDQWQCSHMMEGLIPRIAGEDKHHKVELGSSQGQVADIKWNDADMVATFTKVKELNDKKVFIDNVLGVDFNAAKAAFTQEKAGMIHSLSVEYPGLKAAMPDKEIGYFYWPTFNANPSKTSGIDGDCYVVNATTKYKEQVYKVLALLIGDESLGEIAKSGMFPSKTDVDATKIITDPIMQAMYKDKADAYEFGEALMNQDVINARNAAVQDVVAGKKTPQQAADTLEKVAASVR